MIYFQDLYLKAPHRDSPFCCKKTKSNFFLEFVPQGTAFDLGGENTI